MKYFEYFDKDMLCAKIEYEGTGANIVLHRVSYFTDDIFRCPILNNQTSEGLAQFFARRVVPRLRYTPAIGASYGVLEYNPELMCRNTHGITPQDLYWMRFEDESKSLTWDDVNPF